MKPKTTPEIYAYRINKAIRVALGDNISGIKIEDIVHQFAKNYAPDYKLEIRKHDLESIEGALLTNGNNKSSIILINENILSIGRYNFTLAHEFGHFLLHREIQNEFSCSGKSVLGISKNSLEIEANRFASQLILPNDIVRKVADSSDLCLDNIYRLAKLQSASLSATALACIRISSKKVGFVCVRDGFIKWGIASDAARRDGLYIKSGMPVPPNSAANFEDASQDARFLRADGVEGWTSNSSWKEDGFYSSLYDEGYFLLL